MTQIDTARLSRVLASLTKPKERADSTSETQVTTTALTKNKAVAMPRDPAILKQRLRERLKALQNSNEEFSTAAPIVTVQEILRWEFGEEIFQHPDFERIAGQVATVLMSDESLKNSVKTVIKNMSNVCE